MVDVTYATTPSFHVIAQRDFMADPYLHAFAPFATPKVASLLFAMAALIVLYGLLEVMYRRRWFLKA